MIPILAHTSGIARAFLGGRATHDSHAEGKNEEENE